MITYREKENNINERIRKVLIHFLNAFFDLSSNRLDEYRRNFSGNTGYAYPHEKLLFISGIKVDDIGNKKNSLGIVWNLYQGQRFRYDKEYLQDEVVEDYEKNFLLSANFVLELLIFFDKHSSYETNLISDSNNYFYFDEMMTIVDKLGYSFQEVDSIQYLVEKKDTNNIEIDQIKREDPNIYRLVLEFYSMKNVDDITRKTEILTNLAYYIEERVEKIPRDILSKNKTIKSFKGVWNFLRHNNDKSEFDSYKNWFCDLQATEDALGVLLVLYRFALTFEVVDKI